MRKSPPSAEGSSPTASEPQRGTGTFWAEAVPLTTPPPPTLAQSGSDESRRGVTSFWVDEEESELPRRSPSGDGRRRRGEAGGVGGRGPRGQEGRDADEGGRGSRCGWLRAAIPAAGREGDRASSGSREHLQTRLRAPRGWMGMSGGRRIEERVPGSGVGQREPTDTRLKGVLEQGKGPAIRQRRVGVSPGQCPGALEPWSLGEIGVSSTPSSRKWERKLCPALVPCYLCISCVCHCLSVASFLEPFVSSWIPRVVMD